MIIPGQKLTLKIKDRRFTSCGLKGDAIENRVIDHLSESDHRHRASVDVPSLGSVGGLGVNLRLRFDFEVSEIIILLEYFGRITLGVEFCLDSEENLFQHGKNGQTDILIFGSRIREPRASIRI